MVKRNITIDDLAIMVQGGFSELRTEMNDQFKQIDQKFERVDKKFEQVGQKFWQVSEKIDKLKKDLNIVKTDVAVIKTDLRKLDSKITLVNKRNREDIDAIASDLVLVKKKVSV